MNCWLTVCFWVLGSVLWQSAARQEGGARVEILEVVAARSEDKITIDGRLRNAGQRRLEKLVLVVELLDSDRKLLSQRKGLVGDGELDPEEEARFSFYVPHQPRTVQIRFAAEAARVVHVEVLKPGPYTIE